MLTFKSKWCSHLASHIAKSQCNQVQTTAELAKQPSVEQAWDKLPVACLMTAVPCRGQTGHPCPISGSARSPLEAAMMGLAC